VGIERLIREGLDVLDAAIAEHRPSHLFAMFSGGHDSLAATALTARHHAFTAAVHINTGIGVEQTREFVRSTCAERGWPLLEYGPPETLGQKTYRELVLAFGFPGPAQHAFMFARLKERGIRQLVRDHKVNGDTRLLLSTGIRLEESTRRFRNYSEGEGEKHYSRDRVRIWASPLAEWSKLDCLDLIAHDGLATNEVVELLHLSGECLCGSFARPGEMHELETWFPGVAAELHALERDAEAAGQIGCVWGRRPDDVSPDQLRLMPILPLCVSCEA
jgi:3'-phosphoadenosine 5'-phosphosulfate sulfotransferase (PAPS reductase)/FAD synthetase